MIKKEVGAIFVALLLVATLGAGVASASGVVLGGGYNDTSLDVSRVVFSDLFTTDLWNGSFWDSVAEDVEAVKKAREAREVNESAEAEESPSFWLPGDKTSWPAGYWDVDPNYQSDFAWYDPGYGAVNWTIP